MSNIIKSASLRRKNGSEVTIHAFSSGTVSLTFYAIGDYINVGTHLTVTDALALSVALAEAVNAIDAQEAGEVG